MEDLAEILDKLNKLLEALKSMKLPRELPPEAAAYRAQVKRVFNLPDEKIDLMTLKWCERGKLHADKVRIAKEIYHEWKKKHEASDPSHKLMVWFAILKFVLGIKLTKSEKALLVKYGLYEEIKKRLNRATSL